MRNYFQVCVSKEISCRLGLLLKYLNTIRKAHRFFSASHDNKVLNLKMRDNFHDQSFMIFFAKIVIVKLYSHLAHQNRKKKAKQIRNLHSKPSDLKLESGR